VRWRWGEPQAPAVALGDQSGGAGGGAPGRFPLLEPTWSGTEKNAGPAATVRSRTVKIFEFTTEGAHEITAASNGNGNCGASNATTTVQVTSTPTPLTPPTCGCGSGLVNIYNSGNDGGRVFT